jgi:hypothetical protein
MFGTLKRFSYIVMILSGIASLFITLGTLNGRVPGGLTLANKPWAIAVGVFGASILISILLKIFGPAFDDTRALH